MSRPLTDVLICPKCRSTLSFAGEHELQCPTEVIRYRNTDGIWRLLTPEAELRLSPFIRSYEDVRRAEGRGSDEPSFYQSLPYAETVDKKWSRHWQQRAESYEFLITRVIPELGANASLTILDLGAGNGWLSNRLAQDGHRVIAVDLQTNDFDGLGCHKYYKSDWLPVQAEFDRLPIADASIDLVIFNASLHYSTDLARTLAEATRVLTPSGAIVALDTPFYTHESSGKKMLLEQSFEAGDQIGFLTSERLSGAVASLDLSMHFQFRQRSFQEAIGRLGKRLYLLREPATLLPLLLMKEPA